MSDKKPEMYLGDGVYLTADDYHLILSTGSHKSADWDNVVYLDPSVQSRLYAYLKSIYEVSDDER